MNQKQLQYFVTVYQTKNIQTAADRLFVSRQGVSKVIRLLEEELGQKLFIRSVRGVIPTDYATILLPHARQLLEDYDAIRGLHTLAAQAKSVVTIYSLDHVLAYLGASLIEDFHKAHPSIILSVVDTTDAMALTALSAQQRSSAALLW
ncbi:LysR family transcriptional regulator [Allisonella histaminiformans]|uniref:LysR family transcriptional regulator n=1 Tax=Allisonella histaminiformans TaxID=209880 RepID=UPI003F8C0052